MNIVTTFKINPKTKKLEFHSENKATGKVFDASDTSTLDAILNEAFAKQAFTIFEVIEMMKTSLAVSLLKKSKPSYAKSKKITLYGGYGLFAGSGDSLGDVLLSGKSNGKTFETLTEYYGDYLTKEWFKAADRAMGIGE